MKQIFLLFLIFSSSLGIQFKCNFTYIEVYNETFYGCNVLKFKINRCPTHIIDYEGTHKPGKSDEDVLAIECGIACFDLETIPQGITEIFPSLIALKLRHTAIQTLDGSELLAYPNLKYFQLSNCDLLQEVPGDLFESTKELVFVDLSWNKKLKVIGSRLLNDLNFLTSAFFFNTCADFNAETPEAIEELKREISEECDEPEDEVGNLGKKIEDLEKKIDELKEIVEGKFNKEEN